MPRLRLPPLPPSARWSEFMPRGQHGEGVGSRELSRRVLLASKPLCDRFVRDLKVRKGEVFLDAYASIGQLTRSLLAGGYDRTEPSDWSKVLKEQEVVGPRLGKVKRGNMGQFDYPPWKVEQAQRNELPDKDDDKIVLPKAVIAVEPAVSQMSRGLGFDPDHAHPSYWDYLSPKTTEELAKFKKSTDTNVYPSILENRLLMVPGSVYKWDTVPQILSNPLVSSLLPVYDKSKEGVEATKRPWTADEPHITMVATMPDNVMGDQMMAQWVSSCIGTNSKPRSWMWAWGRIRLAVLVSKGLYDRLLASPGETIHCKLSVMAHALFHIRPLPPYHHVPDVDKQSQRTDTSFEAATDNSRRRSVNTRSTIASPPMVDEVTKTTVGDFWPHNARVTGAQGKNAAPKTPIVRPPLLGVELIPRKDSVIKLEQRDEWEYVLRNCFVREASPLGEVLPSLAFGAENLMPKISEKAETSPYAGLPASPSEQVRHLTVEQWQRIVDVFSNWAFKPPLYLFDSVEVEDNREIGQS